MSDSILRIGLIYPAVLGTYGDSGNALVLAERARRRGFAAEVVPVEVGQAVPAGLDIYTLGGGEDTAQAIAADQLRGDTGLAEAARRAAPILAICASLQLLGTDYTDANGRRVDGLGLLDVKTSPRGSRAIGELVAEPMVDGLTEPLTGFENHGGGTCLGPDAQPLGLVTSGVGNGCLGEDGALGVGDEPKYEGAVQGSIIGTYLHGPALARNPQLADLLLSRVLGPLEPLDVPWVSELRNQRLSPAAH